MEQQSKAPQDLRNVVDFLRSSKSAMRTRVGVLNGKRVDYFKGKGAIKALLSPAYVKLKKVPKVASEAEAIAVLASIIPFAFYLRVDRGQPSGSAQHAPKQLAINQMQMFKPDEYYAWFYEGSQWTTYVGGVAMVAVMLAGVMFPLWPPVLRLGVWYISIGVLGLIGLFIALAIVRLIFYIITVIAASPGIWIFPKLFADVGFVDSFIPLWEWDLPKKKTKKKKATEKPSDDKKSDASPKDSGASTPSRQGGAFIEEVVDDSGDSRPHSRSATVEEVADDE